MTGQGGHRSISDALPLLRNGLASRADRLGLPLLLQRPLEHREACGLRRALAALRLDRLGHELRPGEQRLLRLPGLLVVTVAVVPCRRYFPRPATRPNAPTGHR